MTENDEIGFHDFGLDDRLLKAIAKLGWKSPTPIQEKAIPLFLEGKDLLARARTGSGKTAGFAIPIIQKILQKKLVSVPQETVALVLAPSRELCKQIHRNFIELTSSCSKDVRCLDVSSQVELNIQRPQLMEKPDVIVGTPGRVLAHIQAKNLQIHESLEILVIDEADLVFSFGYEKDIKEVLRHLPSVYQAFLTSATVTEDVLNLKKIVLHNPVVLKLHEPQLPESLKLTQYLIRCEDEEKFAVLCALFKLRLVRGKTIIFVRNVDRCYKIKLFLEQFGVNACILNSELPVVSRCHIVTMFNEGRYEIIIASDDKAVENPAKTRGKTVKVKIDRDYGVSRGLDFQFVSNVINFDFPDSVQSYIHRVGRTARGANQGTALSFVSVSENHQLAAVEKVLAGESGEGSEGMLKPYQFKMEQIEGFRYRTRDALRAVTRIAIREARLKEIKAELLNSQKLKSYFDNNPREHQLLRHDKALHIVKHQTHLKHVPEYIVPPMLQSTVKNPQHKSQHGGPADDSDEDNTAVQKEPPSHEMKKKRKRPQHKGGNFKKKKQSKDPLQNFEFDDD